MAMRPCKSNQEQSLESDLENNEHAAVKNAQPAHPSDHRMPASSNADDENWYQYNDPGQQGHCTTRNKQNCVDSNRPRFSSWESCKWCRILQPKRSAPTSKDSAHNMPQTPRQIGRGVAPEIPTAKQIQQYEIEVCPHIDRTLIGQPHQQRKPQSSEWPRQNRRR